MSEVTGGLNDHTESLDAEEGGGRGSLSLIIIPPVTFARPYITHSSSRISSPIFAPLTALPGSGIPEVQKRRDDHIRPLRLQASFVDPTHLSNSATSPSSSTRYPFSSSTSPIAAS